MDGGRHRPERRDVCGRVLAPPVPRPVHLVGEPDEDRHAARLLSGNEDLTLHRPPRCAGLRYVHHQWELFSRDADHSVYIAPYFADEPRTFRNVRRRASRVMPVARSAYEPVPWVLEPGQWLISVGQWVVSLTLSTAESRPGHREADTAAGSGHGPTTQMRPHPPGEGGPAKLGGLPRPDHVLPLSGSRYLGATPARGRAAFAPLGARPPPSSLSEMP